MSDVTQILSAIEQGDTHAAGQLLPLVYNELRKLAALKMAKEAPGQTLDATALVHEAYLRLVGGENEQKWENRRHFFAAAAEAMRRILIDNSRRKQAHRHGGGAQHVSLDHVQPAIHDRFEALLALDEALQRLERKDPTKAELVKLRYFAGLTIPQAAKTLGISITTANRHWAFARAWLHEEMDESAGGPNR